MAFLQSAAPRGGGTWAELLRGTPATADASGFLAGPWGECLVAAARYERDEPHWDRDPAYRHEGPCGQVIEFLEESGFKRLLKAANKLERATHKGLKRAAGGNLSTGPTDPEVWRLTVASPAASAAPLMAASVHNVTVMPESNISQPATETSTSRYKMAVGDADSELVAPIAANPEALSAATPAVVPCSGTATVSAATAAAVERDGGVGGGSGSDGSDSESSGSGSRSTSGSSSGGDGPGEQELLAPYGLASPLPWQCLMNEAVEDAPKALPPEALSRLPGGVEVRRSKQVSDGWHEGYLLKLSAPLAPGQPSNCILRVWRSQLSYWRVDVHTGASIERRAMDLARDAGVATAGFVRNAISGEELFGTCDRKPRSELCDWAIYNFMAHASSKQACKAVTRVHGSETRFVVEIMARLHSLDLTVRETDPLPRFDHWRQHCEYLGGLAAESGNADAIHAVDAVNAMLVGSGVPDLPPALCHFDWHLGNALCDSAGQLQALIDWEFAGVADPRLDLARFIRRKRWAGDIVCRDTGSDSETAAVWGSYAVARFGAGVDSVTALGPPEPWFALESCLVLVIGAVVCSRAAAVQRGEAPDAALPRCGLVEWIEDMETAKWHLRRMQML